jgi:hypothetical protein
MFAWLDLTLSCAFPNKPLSTTHFSFRFDPSTGGLSLALVRVES